MAGNPVTYAENTLGVHVPWDSAEDALARYEQQRDELAGKRNHLRAAVDYLDHMVAETTANAIDIYWTTESEHGPKLSQAGADRYVKTVLAADPNIHDQEQKVQQLRADVELLEGACDILKIDLTVKAARMNELAGLLTFYAMRSPAR
jgi:hypothetical protein